MDESRTDGPTSDEPLVCCVCGAVPPAAERGTALLTWSRGIDRGRTTWTCESCSRENVRAIEGKLDPAWW
ncbi:hypothetical protein GCM10009817_03690 [Terrabacter lapilli]|uniref:Uncharacterized protein n=1 Tax=Terrabacter lapilli TaxID=436231 RepID=A0ABP5CSP3_9MICO